MNICIQFPYKMLHTYIACCKPLCQELDLSQTAFDILMFLANNPGYDTARDIVEVRGIKANLVSVNVDRLVRRGLLERQPVPGDRRKARLLCTRDAQPIIRRGRETQEEFFRRIFDGVEPEQKEIFQQVRGSIEKNLEQMMKEMA